MHGINLASINSLERYVLGKPYVIMTPAFLDAVERCADRILEEIGIKFEGNPDTLDLWRQHGMSVRGDMVSLDGAWLRQIVTRTAPRKFILRARNPLHSTIVGGSKLICAPIYGATNVLLEDGKRRAGCIELYRRLVSIAHASPGLSNTGHMICVLNDVVEGKRPMEMALAHLTCSDKAFMGSVALPSAALQVIEGARAAVGRQSAKRNVTSFTS